MVKKHTKSDSSSSRNSSGASLGSEYSNEACSKANSIEPGTIMLPPDSLLSETGTKRTPSVEDSAAKTANPSMLNSGESIVKVMTEDASRQPLSKLLARSKEQAMYDWFVKLYGSRIANYYVEKLEIFADNREAIERRH